MTTLNTIIEEEKKEFDAKFSDSRYATARAQQIKDFLTTAMQRAYEAGEKKGREEERERAIEIMKDELRTAPLEVQMTKGIVFANIIKRIHSELNQDKK